VADPRDHVVHMTLTQASGAAGVLPVNERNRLLDVATPREVADVAVRRLLRAGVRPWWPQHLSNEVSDPWRAAAAAEMPVIRWPIAGLGRYYHGLRTVVLRDDLIGEQERVTLWHELIHAERGHDGSISHEQHEDVQREACRRARVSFADYPYLGADRA
jgi:hypothetical protein